MNPQYLEHLNRVVSVFKRPHTDDEIYGAVDAAVKQLVGHRLFTVMYVAPGGMEVARVYTNDPVSYPLRGRKQMAATQWGEHVISRGQHYIGRNDDDIRWAFADHELIRSLGLASVLNLSVVHGGSTVGVLNLLDVANHYHTEQLALLEPFGALLAPLLIEAARREA